jgi:hypothetical protein
MNAILDWAAIFTIVLATPAIAQQPTSSHRLGEHPAVIVKRNADKQGYDYASKFYPHPAWLYLHSDPAYDDRVESAARSTPEPKADTDKDAAPGATLAAARR